MNKKQFKNIDFRLNAIAQALTELHNENKFLQSQNKVAEKYADDMEKMSKEFSCRIDKAIEILKLCNSKCAKETIEILKGEDNE